MKKNYTHIVILLDRSGSMKKVQDETIGGFNNFVNDQKKVKGEATLSLIQFDDRYEQNYMQTPINEVPLLDNKSFVPRGWTRYYDALGRAIISTGEGINKLKEEDKPEKVIFAVMTDGQENDSKEFTGKEVSNLVDQQTNEWNWEFVFMGTTKAALDAAQKIGFKGANTMQYADNGAGVMAVASGFSANVAAYRTGAKKSMSFEKKDYDAQSKLGVHQNDNLIKEKMVDDWATWNKNYKAKLEEKKKSTKSNSACNI